jgi:hypothetical protein
MVGDEVLGPLGDPGEVADAELGGLGERGGERQPGWVGEGTSPLGRDPGGRRIKPRLADRFRLRKVEAEKLASIIGRHPDILTLVDAFPRRAARMRCGAIFRLT